MTNDFDREVDEVLKRMERPTSIDARDRWLAEHACAYTGEWSLVDLEKWKGEEEEVEL